MNVFNEIEPKLAAVGKFYFFDYFVILLRSVQMHGIRQRVFHTFVVLKDQNLLGESKYKKLTVNTELQKLNRYSYTFNEVVQEAILYNIIQVRGEMMRLTDEGRELLDIFEKKGQLKFNLLLFEKMESRLFGFYYLVNFCYSANKKKGGLLIFPIYSPLKLGYVKSAMKTTADIVAYSESLYQKLESDLFEFLGKKLELSEANDKLLNRLQSVGLLKPNGNSAFDSKDYNLIVKRMRDYWLNYFLRNIYKANLSLSYFDIWSYRGRQLGIVNTTEFYPDFSGRIIYPISVIASKNDIDGKDFKMLYKYPTKECLLIHQPSWSTYQEQFVKSLYESYFDLKRYHNTYFVNLPDLRDIVCYKMKISMRTFVEFLEKAYGLNLRDELKIKIALESDKLPEETQSNYLKREPIIIDGVHRNIIAIDLKK